MQAINDAFTSMGGDLNDGGKMVWSSICAKLQTKGERIGAEELTHCLEVGEDNVSTLLSHMAAEDIQ